VPASKKTLLLVDDDRTQLAARKLILELRGYQVFTATNARRGMQVFESESPDAVVLDYEMPRVNGAVLAGKIRHANDSIPIVMLSGSASVPSSALTGVDSFIPKAMPPSFLIEAIEVLMHSGVQEGLL
jgi:two-component system, OmpR family, response regulator PrrA